MPHCKCCPFLLGTNFQATGIEPATLKRIYLNALELGNTCSIMVYIKGDRK
jgi:hypothetical protein